MWGRPQIHMDELAFVRPTIWTWCRRAPQTGSSDLRWGERDTTETACEAAPERHLPARRRGSPRDGRLRDRRHRTSWLSSSSPGASSTSRRAPATLRSAGPRCLRRAPGSVHRGPPPADRPTEADQVQSREGGNGPPIGVAGGGSGNVAEAEGEAPLRQFSDAVGCVEKSVDGCPNEPVLRGEVLA